MQPFAVFFEKKFPTTFNSGDGNPQKTVYQHIKTLFNVIEPNWKNRFRLNSSGSW